MGDTVPDRRQAIGGQTGFGSRAPAVLIEYLYGTEYLRDKSIPPGIPHVYNDKAAREAP